MFKQIEFGRYYETTSFWHSLFPSAKLLILIMFVVATFLIKTPMQLSLILILLIVAILTTKVPWVYFLKMVLRMKVFVITLIIFYIILKTPTWQIIKIIFSLISLVLASSILLYTTRPFEITYALNKILKPLKFFKVPVNEIAFLLTLTIRFIPTLLEETDKIITSQASRGADYQNGTLKDKITVIHATILPLFYLSFEKANHLAEAIELRNYDIKKERTYMHLTTWHLKDTLILIFMLIILGVML